MTENLKCWNCGESLADVPLPISRHANCPACFEVLHCCRMCRHFEPDKRPYCDHERAEPPVEKATANFCDYFKPVNRFKEADASKTDKAKTELGALFGEEEPGGEDGLDKPTNKLDDLFDD